MSVMHSQKTGYYSRHTAPFQTEIQDAFSDRQSEEIVVISSRQVGKTTILENLIGYMMRQDPGPAQLVLAAEKDSDEILDRVKDMIDSSPAIAAEKTPWKKDWRKQGIRTRRMPLRLGWAGGSSTLKGRSNRVIFCDEVEAWEELREGHPMKILIPSTNAFWNRKILIVTTPKTTSGYAWQRFLKSDQRRYYVPCPHCGAYQRLYFSEKTVRWPKHERDPDIIYSEDLAAYHCEVCEKAIRETKKLGMLQRGKWVPACQEIARDGTVSGPRPRGSIRGHQFGALYSPWVTFSRMAKEFLEAVRDRRMQEFRNLLEGEPWEEAAIEIEEAAVDKLEQPYSIVGDVPKPVQRIVAGADAQREGGRHLWFTVRGYGPGAESWLLGSGRIDAGFEIAPNGEQVPVSDLEKFLRYLRESDWVREDGKILQVERAAIDAGDGLRTPEIYDLYQQAPGLILPIQGKAGPLNQPVMVSVVEKHERQQFVGAVQRASVDTDYFKTDLTSRINTADGFWIPSDTPEIHRKSLTSEHKVRERSKTGQFKFVWRVRGGFKSNHQWDSEVYCAAAAWVQLLHRLRPEDDTTPPRRNRQPEESTGWMSGGRSSGGGWVRGWR